MNYFTYFRLFLLITFYFSLRHALKAHQATHTGIKPWKCDLCSHWSSSKQALVAHKKVTHGINKWKYKCEHCDDKFIVRGMWVRHMKLHGELSIKCEVCPKNPYFNPLHFGKYITVKTFLFF